MYPHLANSPTLFPSHQVEPLYHCPSPLLTDSHLHNSPHQPGPKPCSLPGNQHCLPGPGWFLGGPEKRWMKLEPNLTLPQSKPLPRNIWSCRRSEDTYWFPRGTWGPRWSFWSWIPLGARDGEGPSHTTIQPGPVYPCPCSSSCHCPIHWPSRAPLESHHLAKILLARDGASS